MPACHAGGRRFEPDPGRQFLITLISDNKTFSIINNAGVAQLVEQLTCNQ